MFRFLQSDIRTKTVKSFSSRRYKYCLEENDMTLSNAYLYSHAKSLGLVFQVKLVCETYDVTANKSYFYETIKNNQ